LVVSSPVDEKPVSKEEIGLEFNRPEVIATSTSRVADEG